MAPTQNTLFDERFLGRHAGQIMSDPTTALVELVANAWDAYATRVEILWPEKPEASPFKISDNGVGMTKEEFELRWRTLDYNRANHQGLVVQPPPDLKNALPRTAYGRNGRGRHAAFLFSDPYRVRSWKNGRESSFLVSKGRENPIEVVLEVERTEISGHGTEIEGVHTVPSTLTPEDVRALIGTRFLMDPGFKVYVNGVEVTFNDIPNDCTKTLELDIEDLGNASIRIIDAGRPDRTTKQHGVAWWVNRRLVGEPGWHTFADKIIDGRSEEAKRYTFIVFADFLASSVEADWKDFKRGDEVWKRTCAVVFEAITDTLSDIFLEKRAETKNKVRSEHRKTVAELTRISRDRWNELLDRLIEKCPTLGEAQISQIMGLLANLELAQSQYSLLEKLHKLTPGELDGWNDMLAEWTIKTAKEVLDEISTRLRLIEAIRIKTENHETDEVQELQPLFGQALWIFGPQFESIEFTSNRGMTTVIKRLFKKDQTASRNRPDFVVLPESSVGLYARPSFDSELNEAGTETLVIVELKKPGVPLGANEKGQVWKYITELMQKGHITKATTVYGYILGDSIESHETGERKEGDRIFIRPMLYSTFIGQAEKRLLNLHKRLSDAPFMKELLEAEGTVADPVDTMKQETLLAVGS